MTNGKERSIKEILEWIDNTLNVARSFGLGKPREHLTIEMRGYTTALENLRKFITGEAI